jgi:hypothetical protein
MDLLNIIFILILILLLLFLVFFINTGRDSDLATRHGLIDRRESGNFPFRPEGHWPLPASCTMSSRSLLLASERPQRDVKHPPPSPAEVTERLQHYICSLSGPSCLILGWALLLPFTSLRPAACAVLWTFWKLPLSCPLLLKCFLCYLLFLFSFP